MVPAFRRLVVVLTLTAAAVVGAASTAVAHAQLDGTLAIQSFRDGNGEIYLVTSSGQTNLTNSPSAEDDDPAWSPDGTKIAFKSNASGNFDIWVMDEDGSNPVNLTQAAGSDSYPTWSPDGSRIAFSSSRDGNEEIFVMNADGSGQTNISNNPAFDGAPRWSPDGSTIAFASTRDGGDAEVVLMNPDGTAQTNITNNSDFDHFPAWSPDSTTILFASNRAGSTVEVWMMDADGTNPLAITSDGQSSTAPALGPDGVHLAYQSGRAGNPDAWLVHLDGTDEIQLTNSPVYDGDPDWKPLPVDPGPGPAKPTCATGGLSGGKTIAGRALGSENENGPISSRLHRAEPENGLRPVVHEVSCVVAAVDGREPSKSAGADASATAAPPEATGISAVSRLAATLTQLGSR